ncbi:MAG: hypothetical protein R3C59_08075 [Planctomycetaceae bacterium]
MNIHQTIAGDASMGPPNLGAVTHRLGFNGAAADQRRRPDLFYMTQSLFCVLQWGRR